MSPRLILIPVSSRRLSSLSEYRGRTAPGSCRGTTFVVIPGAYIPEQLLFRGVTCKAMCRCKVIS